MSGTTITNTVTVTTGIALPGDYTLTNTATGVITNTGVGVLGAPSSTANTVVNAGSIGGTTAGVSLRSGGVVTNQTAGVVTGTIGIAVAVYSGSILNQGQVSASGDAIVIAPGGTVSNASSGSVVAGGLGIVIGAQSGTVGNAGNVTAARTGIVLYGGGIAANQAGGTIVAGVDGIYVARDTATNQGLIVATRHGMFLNNGGTVTNQTGGVISASQQGIVIASGSGDVTNAAGATIAARYDAIRLYGGTETVTNAGTLTGTYGWGVQLQSVGTMTNATGALATGGYGGVRLSAGGTVVNAGTLTPLGTASGDGVLFAAGGLLSNAATGVVQGRSRGANLYGAAATVLNSGLIDASLGDGVLLGAGGSISNDAGATLSGAAFGVYLSGAPAIVVNSGIVSGTANSGIGGTVVAVIANVAGATITGHYSGVGFNGGTPTIVNAGRIQGLAGSAIQGSKGGTVTNLASGDLSSLDYGVALSGEQATVDNAGTIAGTNNRGVYLTAGGAVTNAASGTINGYGGVAVVGASGTVVNAGSIGATGNYAVRFGAGFANRLVIAPGAVFTGKVQGANTAGATAVSTLELASGTAAGTFAGLGTQFTNFGAMIVDAGATWTLATAAALTVAGTAINTGTITDPVTLDVSGVLTNAATGTIATTAASAVQSGTAATGVSLVNSGRIVASGTYGAGGTEVSHGVVLRAGGSVDNRSGGTISGDAGILITGGAGTVANAGTIEATDTSQAGIRLFDGGFVDNKAGGRISGGFTGGVYVAGELGQPVGDATVVNAGEIVGSNAGAGVLLGGAGAVTNAAVGTIAGYYWGISIRGANASVANAGMIRAGGTYTVASGVFMFQGGTVSNAASGTIAGPTGIAIANGPGAVSNAGLIGSASGAGSGVIMSAGAVTNLSTGTIQGNSGVALGSAGSIVAATVDNAGIIRGAYGDETASGVGIASGGTIVNRAGGRISGAAGVRALADTTVDNAGTISSGGTGSPAAAVLMLSSGLITNRASGVVTGATGIQFGPFLTAASAGTVANAGTIIGSAGTAVSFQAGYANRLIVTPGAVFQGTVQGGNTLGSGVDSTLELASAASTGTIAGLSARYTGFGQVTIDAGATWTFDTASTIVADQTLTNAGSVVGSLTLGANARVTNAVGGTINGDDTVGALLGGTSATGVAIRNAGLIRGTGTYGPDFTQTSRGIVLHAGGAIANDAGGTIQGYTAIDIRGAAGTVTNAGEIRGDGITGKGILLDAGGTVVNQAGGIVVGQIAGYGAPVVIDNLGTIGDGALGSVGVVIDTGTITNRAGGTITTDVLGVRITGSGGVVVNHGLIDTSGFYDTAAAVNIGANGRVTNAAGGTLVGGAGVLSLDSGVTVENAGLIAQAAGATDPFGAGVGLTSGLVTNATGGTITGGRGVAMLDNNVSGAATVDNAGLIQSTATYGPGFAIALFSGGTIVNRASGTVSGVIGVRVDGAGGTLSNQGSIIGNGGTAVSFVAGYSHHLILGPTGGFQGVVDGGNAVGGADDSTLELTAGVGTIASLGTQFVNFGQVVIDTGASWTLTGANTIALGGTIANAGTLTLSNASLLGAADLLNDGIVLIDPSTLQLDDLTGTGTVTIDTDSTLAVAGTVASTETIAFATTSGTLALGTPTAMAGLIAGFDAGTFINLPDAMVAQSGTILAGNTLQVVIAGGQVLDFRLDPTHDYQFQSVVVSADRITLSPPCFRQGTLIRTERGDIAVEDLLIGDVIPTAAGAPGRQAIAWIGHRTVDCARHPKPEAVWPVRIVAGAFARGVPARDLWLSPDHAVFVDDVLIPVKHLVNGTSIVQEQADTVTYYHIETPRHDVLLAEGLPCETYLDTGDRANFDNGGAIVRLHPDFAMRTWDALGCAPLHVTGPVLGAVYDRLVARAARKKRSSAVVARRSRVQNTTKRYNTRS